MHTETPQPDPHPTAQSATQPNAQPDAPRQPRPRTSPIVWGLIFLAVCAWVTQQLFFPQSVAPELWITGIILGIGLVLLAVGVAVVIRGRSRTSSR